MPCLNFSECSFVDVYCPGIEYNSGMLTGLNIWYYPVNESIQFYSNSSYILSKSPQLCDFFQKRLENNLEKEANTKLNFVQKSSQNSKNGISWAY